MDERFWHRDIHIVVGHVIPHAVGHPAERQFAQIACAQHQSIVLVGESEQVRRALAGLDVLEGHIIDLFPARKRMADIAEHLLAGRPDIHLAGRDAQRLHQPPRVRQRQLAGGKPGHGVGQDIFAGQAHPVHRPGGDDERLGRVQTTRHTDNDAFGPGAGQPLEQAVHLDVVSL